MSHKKSKLARTQYVKCEQHGTVYDPRRYSKCPTCSSEGINHLMNAFRHDLKIPR